jgi:outer membrane protein assembly factor BamB
VKRTAARTLLFAAAFASAAILLTCRRNNPPDTPIAVNWPPAVWRDSVVEYRVVVSDIDGDEVALRYEWADSTVSEWSALHPAGDTITVTHTWDSVGSYNVRVQARDEHEKLSWWTDYFVQMVLLRQPPLAPSIPVGPVKGGVDSVYTFTTIPHFSSPTRVSIRFEWGDGETSDWSELVAPGETVAMTHAWALPDTYAVRAMCRDTANIPSTWSDPDSFIVRPVDTLRKWRVRVWEGEDHSSIRYTCPAIAADGTVYVGSSDSSVYAFNPDGSIRWRYVTGEGCHQSAPTVDADGTVFVGSFDGYLYALGSDGSLRWRLPLGDNIRTSPAAASDGTVYCIAHHDLYAVDPVGNILWQGDIEYSTRSSPAVGSDGTVYAFGANGRVFAFGPDGTLRWRHDLDIRTISSPALGADGTIYFGGRYDSLLVALNPDSSIKWVFRTPGELGAGYSSPVVGPDGTIYIGCADDALYAVNADGSLRWRFQTGGNVYSTPSLASDGTVYVGSDDHCLYSLHADGTLKWQYEFVYSVRSHTTIAPDGTVYIVSGDGWLYALKGTAPLADSPWPKFQHDARNTGRFGVSP